MYCIIGRGIYKKLKVIGLADIKMPRHKSSCSVALVSVFWSLSVSDVKRNFVRTKKLKIYVNFVPVSCRSAKELLESSLFQAQQQVSQLEVTNSQLEMKVQAISQAKEVIQGETFS